MRTPFSYRVEQDEKGVVLRLAGSLTQAATSELQREFHGLIDQKRLLLVLDFESVTFIDSVGIGMLLMFNAEYRRMGGRLGLAGAKSAVANILQMATRNLVFKFYRDADTARRELEGGPEGAGRNSTTQPRPASGE